MNERTTLCVGSWQRAMSSGIIEITDDTEHSCPLEPAQLIQHGAEMLSRGKILRPPGSKDFGYFYPLIIIPCTNYYMCSL